MFLDFLMFRLGELLGILTVLVLLRPLALWYLKINQGLKLLASIDESLKQLPAVQTYQAKKEASLRRAG
jgi:hypothetical protein